MASYHPMQYARPRICIQNELFVLGTDWAFYGRKVGISEQSEPKPASTEQLPKDETLETAYAGSDQTVLVAYLDQEHPQHNKIISERSGTE